jgi:hypothetical protein
MRQELQANGIAPLNLQALLLPGQGQAAFIEDTHAARLTVYAAGAQAAGTGFFETDRNVIYISNPSLQWRYAAGVHQAAYADIPSDLGTLDAGFIFYATDQSNAYIWDGSAWATIADRILVGGFYGIFTHANSADRTYTFPDDDGDIAYATAALTADELVVGAGTSQVAPLGDPGTTTTVLHGNAAGLPSFAPVDLENDVSGELPVANGGTGGNDAASARASLDAAQIQAPGGPHTIPLAKITGGGTDGSLTFNAEGVITGFVDPT